VIARPDVRGRPLLATICPRRSSPAAAALRGGARDGLRRVAVIRRRDGEVLALVALAVSAPQAEWAACGGGTCRFPATTPGKQV
jgi:hypothetical protein